MTVSVFLPMRAGSARVRDKNSRPFLKSGDSLFQLKMRAVVDLAKMDAIEEVVISTNDRCIIEQASEFSGGKIKVLERPGELCLSTTKVVDLINYVPSVCKGDHIFWLHVTSPFFGFEEYKQALEMYFQAISDGQFDSLMSVNEIRQFIWDDSKKEVINVDRRVNRWPNTQDIAPLYEINHAFYIASRLVYQGLNDRIGESPKLFICDGLLKMDIDWEEDFRVAKLIADSVL
ncbi:cytidylyltransferase domain-containing protein [Alcanivorax sp. 1008]|uniref:acylneuraminate cytidylyltransferase family protein n=1 Tax=Alcanivorax sp. 1008 TaxID=2816853 RepID=UPI001D504250|nr:hypothetical protein [Alcanivorax sp. 1008]MCC1495974.1 hypothetical protein [Alcanivorax sp. 1008]